MPKSPNPTPNPNPKPNPNPSPNPNPNPNPNQGSKPRLAEPTFEPHLGQAFRFANRELGRLFHADNVANVRITFKVTPALTASNHLRANPNPTLSLSLPKPKPQPQPTPTLTLTLTLTLNLTPTPSRRPSASRGVRATSTSMASYGTSYRTT